MNKKLISVLAAAALMTILRRSAPLMICFNSVYLR